MWATHGCDQGGGSKNTNNVILKLGSDCEVSHFIFIFHLYVIHMLNIFQCMSLKRSLCLVDVRRYNNSS